MRQSGLRLALSKILTVQLIISSVRERFYGCFAMKHHFQLFCWSVKVLFLGNANYQKISRKKKQYQEIYVS